MSTPPGPPVILHSARRVDSTGVVDDFWLETLAERIVRVGVGGTWRERVGPTTSVRSARGATLVPGFIDLHGHGGGGASFDEGLPSLRSGLAAHRAHGTTRSVVSLVSADLPDLARSLSMIAEEAETDPLVLGAHLEGPFLALARRGAHDPLAVRLPDADAVERLIDAGRGVLRQITIAPELPGALAAIDRFVAAGVVVAIGHTEADAATARLAFDRGATLVTHAFNALPGIHHRAPGPLPVALADERVVLELIVDGEHVHPDVVRLAFAAAPGRIALITDAMAAAAAPDGRYLLGSQTVEVSGGRATLAGSDVLAGSTLTQDAALRGAIAAGVDERTAVEALTLTPARVLGRGHEFGLLAPGYRADAVLLDAEYRVTDVWADGAAVLP